MSVKIVTRNYKYPRKPRVLVTARAVLAASEGVLSTFMNEITRVPKIQIIPIFYIYSPIHLLTA